MAAIKVSLRIRRSGTMHAVDHLVQLRQSGDHAHWRAGAAVGGQGTSMSAHFRQAILHLTAERICHGALSFRASTFGRGSFLFMIAKLPELVRPPDDRARHRGGC